jgi:hypothetical protein
MVSTSDRSPASHRPLSYADRLASTWQDLLLLVGRVMLGLVRCGTRLQAGTYRSPNGQAAV